MPARMDRKTLRLPLLKGLWTRERRREVPGCGGLGGAGSCWSGQLSPEFAWALPLSGCPAHSCVVQENGSGLAQPPDCGARGDTELTDGFGGEG